ncbi:hypothetical protein NDU88_001367 [Pleurodeles waltl]|uniref:Uncharacterized protein n=1 Tax=Pleurodeles waltl TaxID=8319 RepID=A0AAV7USK9_PLEWA|nr:hypothetical protein NDU88_001367 [Pleurodeles waltl]
MRESSWAQILAHIEAVENGSPSSSREKDIGVKAQLSEMPRVLTELRRGVIGTRRSRNGYPSEDACSAGLWEQLHSCDTLPVSRNIEGVTVQAR